MAELIATADNLELYETKENFGYILDTETNKKYQEQGMLSLITAANWEPIEDSDDLIEKMFPKSNAIIKTDDNSNLGVFTAFVSKLASPQQRGLIFDRTKHRWVRHTSGAHIEQDDAIKTTVDEIDTATKFEQNDITNFIGDNMVHPQLLKYINTLIKDNKPMLKNLARTAIKYPQAWLLWNSILGGYAKMASADVDDSFVEALAKLIIKQKSSLDRWSNWLSGFYDEDTLEEFSSKVNTAFNALKYSESRSEKAIAIDTIISMAHIQEPSIIPALAGFTGDKDPLIYTRMGKITKNIMDKLFSGKLEKAHQAIAPFQGGVFDEQKHRWIQPEQKISHRKVKTTRHLWERVSRVGYKNVRIGIRAVMAVDALPDTGWWKHIENDGYIVGHGNVIKTVLSSEMHPNGVRL